MAYRTRERRRRAASRAVADYESLSTSPDIRCWDEEDGARVYLFAPPSDSACPVTDHTRADYAEQIAAAVRSIGKMWVAEGSPSQGFAASNGIPEALGWATELEAAGFVEVFAQIEMEATVSPSPQMVSTLPLDTVSPDREMLSALWHLNNETYSGRQYTSVTTPEGQQAFVDAVADPSLWEVVLDQESHVPVAFVGASIDSSGTGWIEELSVHPDARRQGLGGALLRNALTNLSGRGVSSVRLVTDRDNVSGARTLYEQFGFREAVVHSRYRLRL